MKLNKQIAAAYIGCDVWEIGNNVGNMSGIMTLSDRTKLLVNCSSNDHYWSMIDLHQLILWPLSAISNEDLVELVSIGGWSPQGQGNLIKCKFDFTSNEVIAEFENSRYRVDISFGIVDFLRASEWEGKPKRAYDVGYGSIESLIKAGIAIDATTL